MKISNLDFGFPLIVIDDYYSNEELNLIWEELIFLGKKDVLYLGSNPKSSGALNESGIPLKTNYSVFLDDLFSYDRNFSNILKVNRKIFNQWDNIISQNDHWFYKNLHCVVYYTLLSYYEHQSYYGLHRDNSTATSLSWFYKEPKQFDGGDLIFENGSKIEVKNNRTIIFPSMILHEVNSVIMEEQNLNKQLGRFCITQFLHTSEHAITKNKN